MVKREQMAKSGEIQIRKWYERGKEKEKRRCRKCGRGEETWKHVWEDYVGGGRKTLSRGNGGDFRRGEK